MRKKSFCILIGLCMAVLTACLQTDKTAPEKMDAEKNIGMTSDAGLSNTDSSNAGSSEADTNIAASDTGASFITVTEEIVSLENGLSVTEYRGDYGFDLFLEQGGASSDREVFAFLVDHLLSDSGGLDFKIPGFGCSTISVPAADGEGYYFGRNFDWNKCDALIMVSYPENAYHSISTINTDFIRQAASRKLPDDLLKMAALYAPLDGMNEKGLCISVNMIQDNSTIDQKTDKPDITTTTAIRLLLDQAATVEEALALLESYDMHASFGYMIHFAIADAEGNAVAVEYVDNEMSVIQTPILTNFYLTEGEKYGIGTSQSHTRFEILENRLSEKAAMDAEDVRDTLSAVSKRNFGEFESTEWSVVFDQNRKTATYFHRENYDQGFLIGFSDENK